MKIWQIVAIVAAGVVCGVFEPGRFTYALGQTTLFVFLPPLLFEAAWNLNYRAIVRQWPAIATLAGPGVILTALIVAGTLSVVRVPFGPALLTGAILSATDPIAVVAVFRRLKLPLALVTIVECESLFNDAVAVVLYRGVMIALAAGAASWQSVSVVALVSVLGAIAGTFFGIGLAFVTARVLRSVPGAGAQIAATVACAYGAYFAADLLGISGIFATISYGIALRYFERRWITLKIAEDVNRFWDVAALLANALVFFLMGAALQIGHILQEPVFVLASLVAVVVARAAVAGQLLAGGYPREWLEVVRSAGLRGALSIALALALPRWVPYREAIVDAAFAVALATLASSSITVLPAARRAAARTSRVV
jgi:monovalent cation:H+ antiporter, CPA1 family